MRASRNLTMSAVLAIAAMAASCSLGDDDSDSLRSFDMDATPFIGEPALDAPQSPEGSWGPVSAVIVEAPEKVEPGTTFPVVIELRNGSIDPFDLDPCPTWIATMGESSVSSNVEGHLPCEEIGSIAGGERIRLEFDMPATDEVVTGEGGEFASLLWHLPSREPAARVPIPMYDE
jgi:hypothetical protein